MLVGIVKWFDPDKGFGVLGTPEEEIFIHINSFLNKPDIISKGTAVIFTKKTEKLKSRISAENSRLVGEREDWKLIFGYLGKSDKIGIEVKINVLSSTRKSYIRRETQQFSVIGLSLKQFLKGRNESDIFELIIEYFTENLNTKYFISYCEHIQERISKEFPSEVSSSLLNRTFSYFGQNLNEETLFEVWKHRAFRFISFTEDEYEIPEDILKSKYAQLELADLNRIKSFSYGFGFCSDFVKQKFINVAQSQSASTLKNLYQLLDFFNEDERESQRSNLDKLYANRIEIELFERAKKLERIFNDKDFQQYEQLCNLIPYELPNDYKLKIRSGLNKIIASSCSERYKPELWLKGLVEDPSFENIKKSFFNNEAKTSKRVKILSKLSSGQIIDLLIDFSSQYGFLESFTLIEEYVREENSLGCYFKLSESLFDTEFWSDKKCFDIVQLFNEYVNNICNEEQKYELFFKGYFRYLPKELILQNIDRLDSSDFEKIFRSISDQQISIKEILEIKVEREKGFEINYLYDLALEFLDTNTFNLFDKYVFQVAENSEYFKLWELGLAKILPEVYLDQLLNENLDNYSQINGWIKNGLTTNDKISEFLFSNLETQQTVTDRMIFYKQFNHIKYLLDLDELNLERIKELKNDFYSIILWFFEKNTELNFDLLKNKLIYFGPDEQVKIIKKLFSLKATGQFDLTLEKLEELTRFDPSLYQTARIFNSQIPIDLSTDLVIKSLVSFKQNQRFFVESDLLTIILTNFYFNKKNRFKFSHYFQSCSGRQTAKFNWSTEGEIRKIHFGDNNKFYFAISFPTGETKRIQSRWGFRDEYIRNPNFEKLKDAVKNLPGAKWHPGNEYWGISSRYEIEVMEFAKSHRFFLALDGSNYANNVHLATFQREEVPNGISFCEGRLANRVHETFKKEFWWCAGQPCFRKCEKIHTPEEWEQYSLLDFCEILGFNTDETNKMGNFIPKGQYYQFIASINRFNRLLERLYCADCSHILYPSNFGTSHFAAHTVVRFQCRNESCSNNEEIYLNHCLNGQCNCIIDSRVSKKCSNGLFICQNCGSCCSHEMFKRRLSNLVITGAYIHDRLKICVNEKLGHLEKAEYFCYKCENSMIEVSNDKFQCHNCEVTYDTKMYNFKRSHRHLRMNPPIIGEENE